MVLRRETDTAIRATPGCRSLCRRSVRPTAALPGYRAWRPYNRECFRALGAGRRGTPSRRRRRGVWARLACGRYHEPRPACPPPTQRWTLMQLLSMSSRAGASPAPASALKMPPRCRARTTERSGYRASFWVHRHRRSRASARRCVAHGRCHSAHDDHPRGLPRTSVRSSGSIRANCVSENQKKSDISPPPRSRSEPRSDWLGNPVIGSGPQPHCGI